MNVANWRTPGVVLACGSVRVAAALGVLAAILCLPIDEREIAAIPAGKAAS